jgi:uncharacterized membrane protein
MYAKFLEGFAPIDWIALVVFFVGWSIYGYYADHKTRGLSGLIAVAGTVGGLMVVTAELAFGHLAAREVVEVKVVMLAAVFIFAYFKFTWSLRQFNFLSILAVLWRRDFNSAALHVLSD